MWSELHSCCRCIRVALASASARAREAHVEEVPGICISRATASTLQSVILKVARCALAGFALCSAFLAHRASSHMWVRLSHGAIVSCPLGIVAQSLSAQHRMRTAAPAGLQAQEPDFRMQCLIATVVLSCIAFVCACACAFRAPEHESSTIAESVPLAQPQARSLDRSSDRSSDGSRLDCRYGVLAQAPGVPGPRAGTLSSMSSTSSAADELSSMYTQAPAADRRDAGGYSLEEQLRDIETELGWKHLAEQQQDPANFVRCLSAGPARHDCNDSGNSDASVAVSAPAEATTRM